MFNQILCYQLSIEMIQRKSTWVLWVYKAMKRVETAHIRMNGHKMQLAYLVVVLAVIVQQTFAEKFPKFIKKCKVSDPSFDDCVLYSANKCMHTVFHGDPKYGIARVEAFSNTIKTYHISENFHITFINQSTNFYDKFVITKIHFDFQKKLLTFRTRSPHTEYFGRYEAEGEILGKPVYESGTVNMTFGCIELNAVVKLDFKMKNNRKYLKAVSSTLGIKPKNFRFNPYDQVTVGEPMTAEQRKVYQSYIDQLPELIKKDGQKLCKSIETTMNTVFDLQPFEEIFLP